MHLLFTEQPYNCQLTSKQGENKDDKNYLKASKKKQHGENKRKLNRV